MVDGINYGPSPTTLWNSPPVPLTLPNNIPEPPTMASPIFVFGKTGIKLEVLTNGDLQFTNEGSNSVDFGYNSDPSQTPAFINAVGDFWMNHLTITGYITKYGGGGPAYNTAGLGVAPIYGIASKNGVSTPDSSPTTLYTTTGTAQLYRVSLRINATSYTSGTATFTVSWTENGTVNTLTVSASATNTPSSITALIQPDNGTKITSELTGTFVATLNAAATVEELA